MKLRTFRAATMQDALAMVRRELGEDAALLHTREVRGRLLWWLPGRRQIELTASQGVNVPSRLSHLATTNEPVVPPSAPPPVQSPREKVRTVVARPYDQSEPGQIDKLRAQVDNLRRQSRRIVQDERHGELLGLLAELLAATAVVVGELEEEPVRQHWVADHTADDLQGAVFQKQ